MGYGNGGGKTDLKKCRDLKIGDYIECFKGDIHTKTLVYCVISNNSIYGYAKCYIVFGDDNIIDCWWIDKNGYKLLNEK